MKKILAFILSLILCLNIFLPAPIFAAENPFDDVPSNAWYKAAVLWAVEKGITTGTSATTFSPNETCTRGAVVTFLWRAFAK